MSSVSDPTCRTVIMAQQRWYDGRNQEWPREPIKPWRSPWSTLGYAIELGDALRACRPKVASRADWPYSAEMRSRIPGLGTGTFPEGYIHEDDYRRLRTALTNLRGRHATQKDFVASRDNLTRLGKAVGNWSITITNLAIDYDFPRTERLRIEASWRWLDVTGKPAPRDDRFLAFQAALEVGDTVFAYRLALDTRAGV